MNIYNGNNNSLSEMTGKNIPCDIGDKPDSCMECPGLKHPSFSGTQGSRTTRGIEQQNYIHNKTPPAAPPSGPDDEPLPQPIEDPLCTPSCPRILQFESITAAAFKIKSGIVYTPCDQSHLHRFTAVNIFLKKEFMQFTGSFKERGARYALQMLTPEQKTKGVTAASAGNHSQALAYHGKLLNIPVTVVMPTVSPIMKIQNCRALGANVIIKGKDITEAKLWAMDIGNKRGMVYMNGYDNPNILAGQGTVGLEILEQVPDLDAVVVPVGGGSLIAGISVAMKTLKPDVRIIGVESTECLGWTKALEAGKPVLVPVGSTLADGLAVPLVGYNSYATVEKYVDRIVVVEEEWIALAILRLMELEKCVVEGAGAIAVAAVLAGYLDDLAGKKVVLVLTGGNIDSTVLGRVIDRGLAADGRLVKFSVEVIDRPGGLQELCFMLGSLGVSIKDIIQERAWIKSDVFKVRVKMLCETRDMEHAKQLESELVNRYEVVRFGEMMREK